MIMQVCFLQNKFFHLINVKKAAHVSSFLEYLVAKSENTLLAGAYTFSR